MTDKFRRTEPLNIAFADGEIPTSAKLNTIVRQSRNGSRILEKGIGDLWNQSGDSVLSAHPLKIPNLARIIGKNDLLSPIIHGLPYHTDKNVWFKDTVYKFVGQREGWLTFPPASITDFFVFPDNDSCFNTRVTEEKDVDENGKYWIDSTTGRFRCFKAISEENKETSIAYKIDPSMWLFNNSLLPSVIPDVRQSFFTGCRISKDDDGSYYLHLPPRSPLVNSDKPSRYPAEVDWNLNIHTEEPNESHLLLWEARDLNSILKQEAFYRYSLPKEIADVFSSLAPGTALPNGMLYLWDADTNTIIEDVVFYKPSNYTRPISTENPTFDNADDPWVLEIVSPSYNLESKVTSWRTEPWGGGNRIVEKTNDYQTSLFLITTGASVASNIAMLYKLFHHHKHDNGSDFSCSVGHNNLDKLHDGTFQPSAWINDHHPQYLHRRGATNGDSRDNVDNAMLGDLLLAQSDNSLNLTGNSYRIVFGDYSGPSIFYNFINQGLKVLAQEYGYGLIIETPRVVSSYRPARATLRIVPQVNLPSTVKIGDISVLEDGTIYIGTADGYYPSGTGIWTKIGSQT